MRHFSLLVISVFLFCSLVASSQTFTSAQRAGNNNNDAGNGIFRDNSGNLYVAGEFTDSIKFGALPTLLSSGSMDIFIVKFNAEGVAQWAKKYGGTGVDRPTDIKLDGSGNIYLCGSHSNSINFDGIVITPGSQNIFVVKLNSSVIAQWAVTAGSSLSDDLPTGLGIDNSGNVYIAGNFSGIASFGNGNSLTSMKDPPQFQYTVDAFIAKYNSSGVCQWARQGSSYATDNCYGIATDNNGNSYITGFYGQTPNFSGYTLPFDGIVDIFIAGYNSSGNVILLTTPIPITEDSYEAAYGISLDNTAEHIYITGLHDGYLGFGPDTIQPHGSYDMFVACYETDGTPLWARSSYSTQWESGRRVKADEEGNVYVVFEYYHSGTPPFPEVTFTSQGYWDPVVVKYTNTGEFVWANIGGSTSYDYPLGLAIGDSGKVWLTGSFGNPATFGPFSLTHMGSATLQDFFLVKMQSDLITGELSGTSFCAGETINVPFTTKITYNAGNAFTAQLSDLNGSFAAPVSIGTLFGTTSGVINATIPANTAIGTRYRIRVVSSDPGRNGGDNETDISIHGVPSVTISANGNTTFCSGGSVLLSAVGDGSVNFQWYKNGIALAGATNVNYLAVQSGDYTCMITNSFNCTFTSNTIHVTVNPVPPATIGAGGPTSFCTGASVTMTSNTNNNFTYQWMKNSAAISGATGSAYTANTTASYTIVITNQYGCSNTSNAISVTVNPKPSAFVTAGGPVEFCKQGTVTLNANTDAGLSYQWKKDNTNISGATNASYIADASGSYKVTVSTPFGCTKNSNTVTVIEHPKPAATTIAQGPTTFCSGGSVVLAANTGAGLTYKWKKNGQNISGATNSTYTATTAGDYKVQVTDQNGCKKTSPVITVTVPCKKELGEEIPFSLYPNPSDGHFTLTFNEEIYDAQIEIVNVIGQQLLSRQMKGEKTSTFSVSEFPAGYYFLNLTSGESNYTIPIELIK